MPDAHKNFAISTVATAPSPATSGTSLVVAAGTGALFPAASFNCTIWPANAAPTSTNSEIVRVTVVSTDTFTITRAQESTSARTVVVGDQICASITAKTLTDIESTSADNFTQYALLVGRSGGQTLTGGTGSSDILTLTGSTSATHAGSIGVTSKMNLYNVTETVTATTYRGLVSIAGTYTLNFANADFGTTTGAGVIEIGPTIIAQQSMFVGGLTPIRIAPTVKNLSSVNSLALVGGSVRCTPTFTGDTQAGTTLQSTADLFSRLTLNAASSGTITASGDYVNFEAALTLDATNGTVNLSGTYEGFRFLPPTLTNSPTLATVYALRVDAHSAGSTAAWGIAIGALTGAGQNRGIDISKPSGGTENTGLKNSGSTVFTSTLSTISAVGSTIDPSATYARISNSTGGSLTLTSAPTIADGIDGQLLVITCTSTQSVVLQDQNTLASSNLRLVASSITLGTRDSVILMYNGTVSDWIQITAVLNVL